MRSIKKQTMLMLGLSIFALAGCSGQGYSKLECSANDFEVMGERDAMAGKAERGSLIKDSCMDGSQTVDIKKYSEAYQKSVPVFCSNTEPFDYGFEGNDYESICDSGFDDHYALGRELFDTKYQIWKYQNEVDRLKRLKNMASQGGFGARNTDDYQRKILEAQRSIALTRAKQINLRKQAVEKGFLEPIKTILSKAN